jgi:Iap family predicted aminopeptidase
LQNIFHVNFEVVSRKSNKSKKMDKLLKWSKALVLICKLGRFVYNCHMIEYIWAGITTLFKQHPV